MVRVPACRVAPVTLAVAPPVQFASLVPLVVWPRVQFASLVPLAVLAAGAFCLVVSPEILAAGAVRVVGTARDALPPVPLPRGTAGDPRRRCSSRCRYRRRSVPRVQFASLVPHAVWLPVQCGW